MRVGLKILFGLILLGWASGMQTLQGALEYTVVPVKKTEQYMVSNWRVKDGLPFDQIRDIIQQHNGFIWVATLNGAARFDGVHFETFNTRTATNLANNAISALYEDRHEVLWLGHDTGHLTVFDKSGFHAVSCPAKWPKEPIAGFIEDDAGTVWAINRIGDMLPLQDQKSGLMRSGSNPQFITIRNGKVLTSANGHITAYESETFPAGQALIENQELSDPARAFPGRDDRVWVFAEGKLQGLSGSKWVEDLGSVPWQNPAGLTLLESRRGSLFVGTPNDGLFIFDRQGGIERITRDSGIDHNNILCLYEDREGTVWAGTKAGLTSIRPKRVNMIRTTDAWNHRFLRAVAPRSAGGVWVGTDGNGLYSVSGQEVIHVEDGISRAVVQTVLEDHHDTVWMNSPKGFLFRIDSSGVQELVQTQQSTGEISALYQENNGMLWAGGSYGLWRWNGVDWLHVTPDATIVSDVRCITSDRDGAIWFGMASGGLGRLFDGELRRYGNADGLPSEYIRALYFDLDDDSLWIGTCGGGLVLWKNNRFTTISIDQGLPGNVISFILDDQRNRLWMITNQGLAVVDKRELRRCVAGEIPSINPLLLDASDGLSILSMSDGLPAGCRTPDGQLYFATDSGLVTINPDEVERSDSPIPVIIKSVSLGDQTAVRPESAPLNIAPGVQQISFDYTALSFISPHRIRFMCRLIGHDSDWILADKKRSATYQNLRPGTYRFEVKACNSDGIWNETPASIACILNPFFWQTWWFKAVLGFAVVLLAAVFSLGIADRINRRKLIRVEQLRAVDQERARIALDIHDEVGAGLTRISLLSHLINGPLKKCSPAEFPHVRELDQVATNLIRSLDEIVWVITPRNDSLDSLVAYLEKYVAQYLRDTGIRCYLDIPINLPDWPVPGPVRHNLFLVVKEAVNNIVKHSEATQVKLSISASEDKFTIIIRDDGKGITTSADTRLHHGQSGMIRRMEQIGGTLNIQTSASDGTSIELNVRRSSR